MLKNIRQNFEGGQKMHQYCKREGLKLKDDFEF